MAGVFPSIMENETSLIPFPLNLPTDFGRYKVISKRGFSPVVFCVSNQQAQAPSQLRRRLAELLA
jgi:hypothetical protein